jgi:hypothetical protein
MHRLLHFLLVLACLMANARAAWAAQPQKGLGMWVWQSSTYDTAEARQELLRFCAQNQIQHLDVHVRMTSSPDGERTAIPLLPDAEALRQLLQAAATQHVTIAALRGDPAMFQAKNHERMLTQLRAILALAKSSSGPQVTFRGIKYDVEPYLASDWKEGGSKRESVMRDYLAGLEKVRAVLATEASQLWLAADVPFWWDREDLVLDYAGRRQRFIEHVQDRTDYIAIMSYRRTAAEALKCVEDERQYARKIQKVIFPSLETIALKSDVHTTFYGLPPEQFAQAVRTLLTTSNNDPALGGVMLHDYRGLKALLSGNTTGLVPKPQ